MAKPKRAPDRPTHRCRYAVIDVTFKGSGSTIKAIRCPVCGQKLDPREVAAVAVSALREAACCVREDAKKQRERLPDVESPWLPRSLRSLRSAPRGK
jgi:hypothetical protein